MLEDSDLDLSQQPAPEPPRRNRSFFLVAAILGGIMLLALAGIAFYAIVILPQQQANAPVGPSAAELTGTAVAHNLQATGSVTSTPTRTATPTRTPSNTPTPRPPTSTNTPVTPLFTNTGAPTQDPATQTVDALLTQAALAQTQAVTNAVASSTPGAETPTATASALPQSGFGDSSGAPLMLALAAGLLLVIFFARRLRSMV